MAKRAPAHNDPKNYLIHREPPGRWWPRGMIVVYDRRLAAKLTDFVKPTLASLEPGRYVFYDSEGWLTRGTLVEKLKDGAVMERDVQHKANTSGLKGGTWAPKRILGRVRTSQIVATEAEYDRRIPIYDKLIGGKLVTLGYPVGCEPDGLFTTTIAPADDELGRPDLPIF